MSTVNRTLLGCAASGESNVTTSSMPSHGIPTGLWRLAPGVVFLAITTCMSAMPVTADASAARLQTCVVEPITNVQILPGTAMSDLDCKGRFTVKAAIGEREPASLVIRSSMDVSDLIVEVPDLKGHMGGFPTQNIDIKYVKVWYQSGSAGRSLRQDLSARTLVPELLLNDDSLIRVDETLQRNLVRVDSSAAGYVDISTGTMDDASYLSDAQALPIRDAPSLQPLALRAQETRQLWFTFNIPAGTTPGSYHGHIRLRSISQSLRINVPVRLTVLPFSLPPPAIEYSMYYRGQLDPSGLGSISSERKSLDQIRAELQDMARHGVTNPTIYQDPSQLSSLAEVLESRTGAGLDNSRLYYLGIQTGNYEDESRNLLKLAQLAEIKAITASAGAGTVYVYGIDEAAPEHIPGQFPLWDRLHAMGTRTFAAAWQNGEAESAYAGILDLLVLGSPPDRAANNWYRQQGTQVYSYNNPQIGIEDPLLYRLHYGFRAWQYDFDGVMDYAYQHSLGFIWDDFDHPDFRDHVFAYPTLDGVIDTVAWEGFREAVDDSRYIALLAHLSDRSSVARALLEELYSRPTVDPSRDRARIVDAVVEICTASRCLD